ncbi:MAG: hypothetical protein KGO96_10310 [Elusimicrobia bacterium]|nr:hypothetical protein [Elusimicrobiota bacterium]
MTDFATHLRLARPGSPWRLMGRFSRREDADEDYGALLRNFPDCEVRLTRGDAVLMSAGPARRNDDGRA